MMRVRLRASGCAALGQQTGYTANFYMYDYRYGDWLAKNQGFNLLTYAQARKYQNLLMGFYKEHGGVPLIQGFTGAASCCVSVKGGYRMTANAKSYIYTSPCGGNYRSGSKVKLTWSSGSQTADLLTAQSTSSWGLYAVQAPGSGSCMKASVDAMPPNFHMI